MLLGEAGTAKEQIARAVYLRSPRRSAGSWRQKHPSLEMIRRALSGMTSSSVQS